MNNLIEKIDNASFEELLSNQVIKANQLGDRVFYIEDISSTSETTKNEFYRLNFYEFDIPKSFYLLAQEILLKTLGGYTNERTFRLRGNINRARTATRFYGLFFQKIADKYPNRKLCDLNENQIISVVGIMILDARNKAVKNNKLVNRTGLAVTEYIFQAFRILYSDSENMSDSISFPIPYKDAHSKFLGSFLNENNINIQDFLNGSNHHKTIPFYIAMPYLHYCIEFIESTEILKLKDHTEIEKKKLTLREDVTTSRYNRFLKYVNEIDSLSEEEYSKLNISIKNNFRQIKAQPDKITKTKQIISILKKNKLPYTNYPFANQNQVNTLRLKLKDVVMTILFFLSGARQSEIIGLKLDDFIPDDNELSLTDVDTIRNTDWKFKSLIHKTNHGIETIRSISGLAAQAISTLYLCSKTDLNKPGIYLFNQKKTRPSDSFGLNAVKRSYKYFIDGLHPREREHFLAEYEDTTAHSFRHSWADFALRKFDGNVTQKIREHFRHSWKSFMTKEYLEYKLSGEELKANEKEYLKEIFSRICEKDNDFVGPIAIKFKKLINDSFNFIGIDEFEEISLQIDNFIDDIERIEPHEWGFCVLLKSTRTQAQCLDKKTKVPLTEVGSKFEKCSHCIHRLTQVAAKEDVIRIGIQLQNTLESMPIIGKVMRNELEKSLANAHKIVKEIEATENKEIN